MRLRCCRSEPAPPARRRQCASPRGAGRPTSPRRRRHIPSALRGGTLARLVSRRPKCTRARARHCAYWSNEHYRKSPKHSNEFSPRNLVRRRIHGHRFGIVQSALCGLGLRVSAPSEPGSRPSVGRLQAGHGCSPESKFSGGLQGQCVLRLFKGHWQPRAGVNTRTRNFFCQKPTTRLVHRPQAGHFSNFGKVYCKRLQFWAI
jgi:hypothetical protein